MKLETRTFDLYAKVLAIAIAIAIAFATVTAIVTVLLLFSAVSTPSFFSNMEIVHWLET